VLEKKRARRAPRDVATDFEDPGVGAPPRADRTIDLPAQI